MKNYSIVGMSLIAALMLMVLPSGAWAQQSSQNSTLALYDNFDRQLIDPLKWFSQWQCGSPSVMECERAIYSGHLRLRVRDYGVSSDNQGTQYGVSALYLSSAAATDISVDAKVQYTTARECAANPNGAHGQALLFGNFFNGGGGTAADDVTAFLQLDRYPTYPVGEVNVGGFLAYQGQFFDNVDLGLIHIGEIVTMELKWDKPNHRFVVRLFRPSTGTTIEQYMPYTISDSAAAVFPYKALSANAFSPNCTNGVTFADMSVMFDNVRTNVTTAK